FTTEVSTELEGDSWGMLGAVTAAAALDGGSTCKLRPGDVAGEAELSGAAASVELSEEIKAAPERIRPSERAENEAMVSGKQLPLDKPSLFSATEVDRLRADSPDVRRG